MRGNSSPQENVCGHREHGRKNGILVILLNDDDDKRTYLNLIVNHILTK